MSICSGARMLQVALQYREYFLSCVYGESKRKQGNKENHSSPQNPLHPGQCVCPAHLLSYITVTEAWAVPSANLSAVGASVNTHFLYLCQYGCGRHLTSMAHSGSGLATLSRKCLSIMDQSSGPQVIYDQMSFLITSLITSSPCPRRSVIIGPRDNIRGGIDRVSGQPSYL
jgi:hypothetical protein